ncbi:MAG: hypothetical protein JO256_07405 [Alphaproteobacteria bacterium]|nr:hypothetical protein [Alphaproteobacteria bacterium]
MEIHKPKPMHSWRELLTEIGVVVIGVCIALGAEQTVEWFHWQHKIEASLEAVRLELKNDNGPQAFTRVAIRDCLDQRLDAIQAAIEAGKSRQEIAALVQGYRPPNRTWDSDAWKAVLASDIGSHVAPETMVLWSMPYRWIPVVQATNSQEHEDWKGLQLVHRTGEKLSAGEAETMLAAIQRLRQGNRDMFIDLRFILRRLRSFNADLDAEQKRQLLGALRAQLGNCVVMPSTDFDPFDQLREMHEK